MSLQVRTSVSLKPYNSFAVEAQARQFAEAENDQQVCEALSYASAQQLPLLLLGGGSNLLLTTDVDALVLRMASRGIRVLSDDGERVVIEAEAGESWHPFVQWTLGQGFVGLENLSLIPGTVGAAPVQNIGAYGVELKDLFAGLTALDRRSGESREFSLLDCAFAYRDSLFKRESGHWIILRVRFALSRVAALHLDYGPVRQRLTEQGTSVPTALDVSRAICAIRSEKLPDPSKLGNAGSFFKNPLVSAAVAQRLLAEHADLVAYPQVVDGQANGQVKLAAGWLIERAGWKGFREGDAGVHCLQALVLVNYGAATGAQLLTLAQRIQADIAQRFAVELEIEPNVL
jgi:UDP-N-acetylmuramate dehydrogenase